MADPTTRLSPLTGFTEVSDTVTVAEVPFLTQIDLRLDPSGPAATAIGGALGLALPTEGGTSARSGAVSVLWLGPDEWLVVGPPGDGPRLTALLETAAGDGHVSVVDVSAQRTTVTVSGPGARELLAFGCSIDLHPRVFGVGDCAQTMLAHAPVIVVRREPSANGTEPVFWILVRASFAGHLAGWLAEACTDLTGGD